MKDKEQGINYIVIKSLKVMLGLFISSLGAVFMYKSGLGSVPQATIIEGTTKFFNTTYGIATLFLNIFFLTIMFVFDRKIIYIGTIVVGLVAGPLLDLANILLNIISPSFGSSLLVNIIVMVFGSILVGIGTGIYIREDFGIGTLEGVMVIIYNKFKIPMVYSKWIVDILFIIIGISMGASWGIGTIISIIIVGPIMMYVIDKNKTKKVVDKQKNN